MKLGEFEGTTKEFHDLFKNTGFDPTVYMKKQYKVPNWMFVACPIVFIFLCAFIAVSDLDIKYKTGLVILAFLPGAATSICLHLKFEIKYITVLSLIIVVVISVLSLGLLQLPDLVDWLINIVK